MQMTQVLCHSGETGEQIRTAEDYLYATFCPYDFLIMSTVPFPSYDELAMQMQFELRQSTHLRWLRVIATWSLSPSKLTQLCVGERFVAARRASAGNSIESVYNPTKIQRSSVISKKKNSRSTKQRTNTREVDLTEGDTKLEFHQSEELNRIALHFARDNCTLRKRGNAKIFARITN